MKIGIDARIYGVKHAGIGRYTEELIKNLQKIDNKNQYVIFCQREDMNSIEKKKNWKILEASVKHYSINEQTKLPKIFTNENLDLLHVPHFNVPLLYRGKFIVTIHDLLWHQTKGTKVTTLSGPKYLAKYLAYRGVVRNAISRAQKIIVPSEYVKNDLLSKFKLLPNKVIVTYEGAPDINKQQNSHDISKKYNIDTQYILYVGNLYPHKNLEIVVKALKQRSDDLKLVVVCGRSVFWERFREFLIRENATSLVLLVGYIPEDELGIFYKNAKAFIYPTLSEGFGLPGLEAMAFKTPVICSDLSVLREIYSDAALYFDPHSLESINNAISKVTNNKTTVKNQIKKGTEQIKKYSWEKMAKETLKIYETNF